MQEILNSYKSGIKIEAVRLQDVNPPESVKHAFNEVNAAQQEKERLVNTARKQYNEIIPRQEVRLSSLLSRLRPILSKELIMLRVMHQDLPRYMRNIRTART